MAKDKDLYNEIEEYGQSDTRLSEETGRWLGWLGIGLGVIGFFWQHAAMGIIAAIFGIFGLYSPKKVLNGAAIGVGIFSILLGFIL